MDAPACRTVSRTDRVFHGIVAGLVAAVFLASVLQADRWNLGRLSPIGGDGATTCLLRRLTGLPCATCGMTRSFCAVGRGAFGEAFRLHPLGPVLFGILAVVFVRSVGIAVVGRRWLDGTARMLVWSIPVLLAATLSLWVVRLAMLFASGAAGEAWRASLLGRLIVLAPP